MQKPKPRKLRKEEDSLGVMIMPDEIYYGVQTKRAISNFAVSGITVGDIPKYIWSVAAIKKAVAVSNSKVGLLDEQKAAAIIHASEEVMASKFADQFPVDIYQGGDGTSTNMNVNEVIANRANEIICGQKGYDYVHPNSHVNMSQSTNDVIPSAILLSCHFYLVDLLCSLGKLSEGLEEKQKENVSVVKIARTCLQDAVPITFGQQIGAWNSFVKRQMEDIKHISEKCLEIPLSATAVGTMINTPPNYIPNVFESLAQVVGLPVTPATDFFDALQFPDKFLAISSGLKRFATGLSKISNDIRLMSSGPRAGFNELSIPAVQPGSSIMPGKINPVMPEMLIQICLRVYGNDAVITAACDKGELDLNVWESVILYCLYESVDLLAKGVYKFSEACISGMMPNKEICNQNASKSLALSAVLVELFDYQTAVNIAKEANESGETIAEVVLRKRMMTAEEAAVKLDPLNMTKQAPLQHADND